MSARSSSRQDALLAALQRKATPEPQPAPPMVPSEPEASAPTAIPPPDRNPDPPDPSVNQLDPVAETVPVDPQPAVRETAPSKPAKNPSPRTDTRKKTQRVGKPVQFWMHEEDRRLVRELAAWLAGQGIRPTDSMVVRAALRMAKTGPGLLEAYRQAALLDGRLKPRS